MFADHAYPQDLAKFVRGRWRDADANGAPLPEPPILEQVLSTAYQAALLREEERAVSFRLIVCDPEELVSAQSIRELHFLPFENPRDFSEHEIRQLAPAAKYHRSLIGVRVTREGPSIWGLVHSGPRWLQNAYGGRGDVFPLPAVLVVRARGPGRLAVACGSKTVGEIRGGKLAGFGLDVFESAWLPDLFSDVRGELHAIHAARRPPDEIWAPVDRDLPKGMGQQILKRMLSLVKSAHHGGTILFLQESEALAILESPRRALASGGTIKLKYSFADIEPRRHVRRLVLEAMATLARWGGRGEVMRSLVWDDYRTCDDPKIHIIDEALFEFAHLVAGLADVDGAVVLTRRFELLGFGGEILGDLPDVTQVERAIDLEGVTTQAEPTESVGTRHRSAYRLCARYPGSLALVISQDGSVRFIASKDGRVVFWDHVALGSPEA